MSTANTVVTAAPVDTEATNVSRSRPKVRREMLTDLETRLRRIPTRAPVNAKPNRFADMGDFSFAASPGGFAAAIERLCQAEENGVEDVIGAAMGRVAIPSDDLADLF